MVSIMELWMPIVVSAVIVFIASFLNHMVLKLHKNDYKKLPDEDKIAEAMRQAGVTPGYHTMPHFADMKDAGTPEGKKKYDEGPVAFVTVMPNGMPAIGKFLGMWFAFCLVAGVFAAYMAGRFLPAGADYLAVFRIAGTTAFLAYSGAEPVASIWKGQPWGMTFHHMIDGLVYALLTGGVFGWLWPA